MIHLLLDAKLNLLIILMFQVFMIIIFIKLFLCYQNLFLIIYLKMFQNNLMILQYKNQFLLDHMYYFIQLL